MDSASGETPDPFRCLHDEFDDGTQHQNPYMTFAYQWERRWKEVIERGAKRARAILKQRLEWDSIWETKEVFVELMQRAGRGPYAETTFNAEEARKEANDHPLVANRMSVEDYACLVVHRSVQKFDSIAVARVAPRLRRDTLAKSAEEDAPFRRVKTDHDGDDFEYLCTNMSKIRSIY